MLKLKFTELQQLKTFHCLGQKDGHHLGDQAFTSQVESIIQQCRFLKQQVASPFEAMHHIETTKGFKP